MCMVTLTAADIVAMCLLEEKNIFVSFYFIFFHSFNRINYSW